MSSLLTRRVLLEAIGGWLWHCPNRGRLVLPLTLLWLAGTPSLTAQNGVDGSFRPALRAGDDWDAGVEALAVQADGKVLVGGVFKLEDGARALLARLHADGSLDATFKPVLEGSIGDQPSVSCVLLQKDGRVLVGGRFDRVNGVGQTNLARLNADGTLDSSFHLAFEDAFGFSAGVQAMAQQADGKLLVAGRFASVNGIGRTNLVRLQLDGSVDETFAGSVEIGFRADMGEGLLLALQADGRIVVAGPIERIGGLPWDSLARLLADGAPDLTFAPRIGAGELAPASIRALALQKDGSLVVAGEFRAVNGIARTNLARLRADGSPDGSFTANLRVDNAPGSPVRALAAQTDGRLWVGGRFSQIQGTSRTNLARLHWDGAVDASFDAGGAFGESWDSRVRVLTIQPDGKLLVGGSFTTNHGAIRELLVRFQAGPSGPPVITRQPADTHVPLGGYVTLGVAVEAGPDPQFQWQFNGADLTGATQATFPLMDFQFAQAGDYRVIVRNPSGQVTSDVARLMATLPAPGDLDPEFRPLGSLGLSAPGGRPVFALQPDGHILVGGSFRSVDGLARTNLVRLQPDGGLDLAFDPHFENTNLFPTAVSVLAVQPDGRILVAGDFTHVNGLRRPDLARLWPGGTTDPRFDAGEGIDDAMFGGGIDVLVLQPDGDLLVGGVFATFNGVPQGSLVRLKPDGALDASFNPAIAPPPDGFESSVEAIALQPDGCILMAGSFGTIDGVARPDLARLLPNGRLDPSFDAGSGVSGQLGAEGSRVSVIVLQPDGRIVVGGIFTSIDGSPRWHIARLEANGAVDPGFAPFVSGGLRPDVSVEAIALEANGSLLIGGSFGAVDGNATPRLARLRTDGTRDPTFWLDPPLPLEPTALFVLPEGRYLVGGEAGMSIPNQPSYQLIRLKGDPASPPLILTPPESATRAVGESITLYVEATDNPLTTLQWQHNAVDILGAIGPELALLNLQTGDAGGYRVIAHNVLGTATSATATVTVTPASTRPGAVDPAFSPRLGVAGGVFGPWVAALTRLPDGALMVGGDFETFDGVPRQSLVRLRADGSVDPTFDARLGPGSRVDVITPGANDRLYVAGDFTEVAGEGRTNLVRLERSGALDTSFSAGFEVGDAVNDVLERPDGRVVVAGSGQTGEGFLRSLSHDGLPGPELGPLPPGFPERLAAVDDGGLLIGGWFELTGSQQVLVAVKLRADGSRDGSFAPAAPAGFHPVWGDLDAAGRLYVAVQTLTPEFLNPRLLRFRPDGQPDAGYDIALPLFDTFAVQPDGKALMALRRVSGPDAPGELVRFNKDGGEDAGFGPALIYGGGVATVVADGPDSILLGGGFTEVNRSRRVGVARLFGGAAVPTAPTITLAPSGGPVREGTALWLAAAARGFPTPQLQWQRNGVDIPGATDALFLLPEAQSDAAGPYSVVVWNEAGRIVSGPVLIDLTTGLQLRDWRVEGGRFSFSVPTEPGRRYEVETATDLDEPGAWDWVDAFTGDGSVRKIVEPAPGGMPPDARRFYRVRFDETPLAPIGLENLKFTYRLRPSPRFDFTPDPLVTTYRASLATSPARGAWPEEAGTYTYTRTGPASGRVTFLATNELAAGLERTIHLRFEASNRGVLAYTVGGGGQPLESGLGDFMTEAVLPPGALVPARITQMSMWFSVSGPGCAISWQTTYGPWKELTKLNATQATLLEDDPCDLFGPRVLYTLTFATPTSGSFQSTFRAPDFSGNQRDTCWPTFR